MNLQPLDDRVIVEPMEGQESKSAGGIIIPDTAKEKPRMGIVKAVGTDRELKDVVKLKDLVKEGDKILYGKYSGDEFEIENKKYLIVKREDILAIVK